MCVVWGGNTCSISATERASDNNILSFTDVSPKHDVEKTYIFTLEYGYNNFIFFVHVCTYLFAIYYRIRCKDTTLSSGKPET